MPRRSTRRRTGRPTLLSPDVQEAIVTAVRAGATFAEAAGRAGVAPRTLQEWRLKGGRDDAPPELRELAEEVHRAHHEARVRMAAIVMRAAGGGALIRRTTRQLRDGTTETDEVWSPPDGRLALDWLSRVDPSTWGRRAPVPIELNTGDTTVIIEPGRLTRLTSQLREYAQRDNTLDDEGDPVGMLQLERHHDDDPE